MRTIIKLGVLLGILLASIHGMAESKSDRIYNMFLNEEGTIIISLSKSAVMPLKIFMDNHTREVINEMEKIRFMVYDESKGIFSSSEVYDRINNEINGDSYFIIDPEDIKCKKCNHDFYDDDAKLIGHGSANNMDELHIIYNERKDCFLFSFYGNITLDDLSKFVRFSHSAEWDFDF